MTYSEKRSRQNTREEFFFSFFEKNLTFRAIFEILDFSAPEFFFSSSVFQIFFFPFPFFLILTGFFEDSLKLIKVWGKPGLEKPNKSNNGSHSWGHPRSIFLLNESQLWVMMGGRGGPVGALGNS